MPVNPKVLEVIEKAKALEREYRRLTGRPLGVTGEVGEVLAASLLGLDAAEVRNPGYDASEMKDGVTPCRYQIKTRVVRSGKKPGGRLGRIDRNKPWDSVLMVLLDENLNVMAIYEAGRPTVEAALDKSDSKARKRGALAISEIIAKATLRWPLPLSTGQEVRR